ncbi:FadR/GntR family transcriptional regulator [Kocuria palustris]|uniref:FadR/GntR family transcriptional regulator n=1 Tax=Kocuria palustris TaxID=71999 RepID=UPI0021A27E24|nr:FCD domain-containing protein [Kocuria palustris]MCT1589610.1 FCD domain-containing protein [Kocuria palustris]
MTTMNRSERAGRSILDKIADGSLRIGEELPSEAELAAELEMSRLTIREAIKTLAARGVVIVRHGRRNRLAPVENWDLLNVELMELRGRMRDEGRDLMEQLTEARQVIEIGAAALAAKRISSTQLDEMRVCLRRMAEAEVDVPDIEAAVEADIAFHRVIIDAAANEYLAATYRPMEEVLRAVRQQTSATGRVRAEARTWHAKILERLDQGDVQGSREAMRGHMEQTMRAVKEERA